MIGHIKGNSRFLGLNSNSKKQHKKIEMSLVVACVLAFVVISLVCVGRSYATATKVGDLATTSTPTLTTGLSSNSLTVSLDAGAFGSANNTISVTTDCPTGYSLSLSSLSTTLDSISASEEEIDGTSGTFATPTTLTDDTWGYAINGNATPTPANTVVNNFDESYSTITEDSSNFAAITTAGKMVKATSIPVNADTTTVYYGVNVSDVISPDTYRGTITYNTVANVNEIGAPVIESISPVQGRESGGETVTITGSNFSMDDTVVAYSVKIGGNDCTDAEVFYDSDTDTETITCTVPAKTGDDWVVDVAVSNWSGSTATLTDGFTYLDETAPVCADITTTETIKSSTQTATISCSDNASVAAYYFGTSDSPAAGDFVPAGSFNLNQSVTSTGTYYVFAKDAAGNTSTAKSISYNAYTVYPVLETTTGEEGTYTSANYTALAGNSYIYPTGSSLTVADAYTNPTGGGTYLGYTTAAPSSSAASLASTAYTVDSDASLYAWLNRTTYTITAAAASGGTVTLSGERSQSSTSSISVRHGESTTATAAAATGYGFSSFSGLISTSTNPYTWNADASGTVAGNFSDSAAPVCTITSGTTATLNCTDAAGVVAYYFGTTLNPSAGSYTPVSSTTSWSATVTPESIGVYYLYAKDAAGNISTVKSAKYLRVEVEVGKIMSFDEAFEAAGKSKSGGYYRMDDMTSSICNAVGMEKTTTLIDYRDSNTYMVGKLKDGKCWMLDNLAFNGKDNQGNGNYITMDTSNTNLESGTVTWDDTVRTGWTSSTQNSYTDPYINDASKSVVSSDAKDQAGQWKVGVYYNYCAASAGTICADSSTGSTVEATSDVCPKGWKLPAGNTSGDFSALAQAIYGSTGSTSDPTAYSNYRDALRLPLSGRFNSGSPSNQGSLGYWWSTTASDGTFRYMLVVDTSGISPAYDYGRRLGYSIRCIAQ